MTKINKIGKSSFVIAILSFLLVGVLAFGGTYAYFTAKTNHVSGSVQTGNLNIGNIVADGVVTGNKLNIDGGIVVPNQVITDTTFTSTVSSNIDYFVRVYFSVKFDLAGHKHYTEEDVMLDSDGNPVLTDGVGEQEGQKVTTPNNTTDADDCKDYIEKAIKALELTLDLYDAVENTDGIWHIGTIADSVDQTTTTEAYFYDLTRRIVDPGENNAVDTTTKVEFPVKIQVKDFLGRAIENDATRCSYWMDAKISISIRFEIMQADCIDGITLDGGNLASLSDAEDAWNTALGKTNGAVAEG